MTIIFDKNTASERSLEVGSHVSVSGRIQSREYQKKLENGEFETRTTYEVSVNKIKVVESEEWANNEHWVSKNAHWEL